LVRTQFWEAVFGVLQEFHVKATRNWPNSRDEARAEVKDLLA
jgi:hypothetical protein